MTNAGRKATAALVAVLTMMAAERASAYDEPIAATDQDEATIVLHVVNYAGLSGDVVSEAQARVARVYEVIGIRIVWVYGDRLVGKRHDNSLHLTVMLLSRDMAQKKISAERLSDYTLGQAHLVSGRAHIFCD